MTTRPSTPPPAPPRAAPAVEPEQRICAELVGALYGMPTSAAPALAALVVEDGDLRALQARLAKRLDRWIDELAERTRDTHAESPAAARRRVAVNLRPAWHAHPDNGPDAEPTVALIDIIRRAATPLTPPLDEREMHPADFGESIFTDRHSAVKKDGSR